MSDGSGGKKGVEAEREPNFLLAPFERRFLPWAPGTCRAVRELVGGADPERGEHAQGRHVVGEAGGVGICLALEGAPEAASAPAA